MDYDLIQGVKF